MDQHFKRELLSFVGELSEMFPQRHEITLLSVFLQNLSAVHLIEEFMRHVDPYQRNIRSRDESFFLHNCPILQELPENISNIFCECWNELNHENREILWLWVDSLVKITDTYKKQKKSTKN